jgi:hypothetical protein
VSSSVRLAIPYASIDSYEHSQQVAHHLGVLPAIAVSLVKKRQRKHFLRIAYHDESKTPQVAIFEVPKKMPLTLLAILQQRAPQGWKPQPYVNCGLRPTSSKLVRFPAPKSTLTIPRLPRPDSVVEWPVRTALRNGGRTCSI